MSNRTNLDAAQAKEILDLWSNKAEAVLASADRCAALFEEHCDKKTGHLSKVLKRFIEEDLHWSPSKFSNLVQISISPTIKRIRNTRPQSLPSSWTTLYAIKDWSDELVTHALAGNTRYDHSARSWVPRKGKAKPAIHADATRSEVEGFRSAYESPKINKKKDKRSVAIATIYVDRSVFEFDRDGEPTGNITLQEVEKIAAGLVKIGSEYVRVDLTIDKVRTAAAKKRKKAEAKRPKKVKVSPKVLRKKKVIVVYSEDALNLEHAKLALGTLVLEYFGRGIAPRDREEVEVDIQKLEKKYNLKRPSESSAIELHKVNRKIKMKGPKQADQAKDRLRDQRKQSKKYRSTAKPLFG